MNQPNRALAEYLSPFIYLLLAAGCSSGPTDAVSGQGKESAPVAQVRSALTAAPAGPGTAATPNLKDWHRAMSDTPLPKKGCFRALHPSRQWEEIPCVTRPPLPYLPAKGPSPQSVGNGNDFSANQLAPISSMVGSFSNVSGVTTETGTTFGANCTNPVSGVANTFALQLNTNQFNTSTCVGNGCFGWQQFIYSNTGTVFMQYWLLNFGAACPTGWNTFSGSCYKNSAQTPVAIQSISNLANLKLTGTAAAGVGGQDRVTIATGTGSIFAIGADSVLNLAPAWTGSEFNIVGDACASQAVFAGTPTLGVKIVATNGTTSSPSCRNAGFTGFTGETNNLNLVPGSCCPVGGTTPFISFSQTAASGVKAGFCLLNDITPTQLPLQ